MPAAKTSFRLPGPTLERLAALAEYEAPDRPNMTAVLVRLVLEAHRAAGLPEPAGSRGATTPEAPARAVVLDEPAERDASGPPRGTSRAKRRAP